MSTYQGSTKYPRAIRETGLAEEVQSLPIVAAAAEIIIQPPMVMNLSVHRLGRVRGG